ncbi:MAG: recombinase [Bacteroidetes bacterium GWA2_40_14]|nr:MAG: recombinase [Bacteroidetes bacterium GWA2_40_14]HAZ04500.1 recombinase [Marinilabiliales bacterium]
MKVALRQRKKGDKISLYLDYYNKGKREYEYLNLYLIPEPEKGSLSKADKDENRKILDLAESIRAKRFLEIKNDDYDFQDREKLKGNFLLYFDALTEKRKDSDGNYGNWDSVGKHLRKYCPKDITFDKVDREWIQGFKDYLEKAARTSANTKLSQNSKYSYFNKLRAAIKQAVRDGIMKYNPSEQVIPFKEGETQREFLTLDELKILAKTECESEQLKTAFLFSCLTGLRWSDINKLVWSEVQYSEAMGNYIRFRQKKTKGIETLPISEQAREMLGEADELQERVFKGLKYSAWHNMKLLQWVMRAGITRTITFHCARHTYATLQLTLGTDIYTVSKLLGHRELRTTQVYAKIIDDKKVDAASKIRLD